MSGPWRRRARALGVFSESGCLGVQPEAGGKPHLRLNTVARPIANKYREGKLKSTLKRELKSTRNRREANGRACRVARSLSVVAQAHARFRGPQRAAVRAARRRGSALASGESRDWLGGGEKAARKVTSLRRCAIGARCVRPAARSRRLRRACRPLGGDRGPVSS